MTSRHFLSQSSMLCFFVFLFSDIDFAISGIYKARKTGTEYRESLERQQPVVSYARAILNIGSFRENRINSTVRAPRSIAKYPPLLQSQFGLC